jgi:hypothetical protein
MGVFDIPWQAIGAGQFIWKGSKLQCFPQFFLTKLESGSTEICGIAWRAFYLTPYKICNGNISQSCFKEISTRSVET